MISTYTLSANNENLSQKEVDNLTQTLNEEFERLTYRKNPQIFDMENMVSSGNKWNFPPNQVTFTPENMKFTNLGSSTMGTLEKVGPHEIFKFNAMLDGLEESWYGFGFRAQNSPTAVAWGGNAQYLFVIKKDTIEFQKWGDENLLIEYPNEYIKDGQWNEYEISAIDQDDGSVTITLKVDGNVVVEYEDKVNPITKPGFFEIYNMGSNCSIEISPVKE